MPKINIDELCEPIEVTVGGKVYKLDDISRETAKKMDQAGRKAEADDSGANFNALSDVMAEILGAPKEDMMALGIRKLLRLTKELMGTINEEIEGKNVQKAVPTK